MAVTYTLYCAVCYKRLVESRDEPPISVRPYESYFICSCCSCETDRGFAIGDDTHGRIPGPKRTAGVSASAV